MTAATCYKCIYAKKKKIVDTVQNLTFPRVLPNLYIVAIIIIAIIILIDFRNVPDDHPTPTENREKTASFLQYVLTPYSIATPLPN